MVDERFLRELAGLGWTYVEDPAPDAVIGLNCPPFGQGYGRIVTLRLDHAMPALFVSLPDHPRSGIAGLRIPNRAGLLVVCDDPGFAEAVLEVVQPALVRWARQYPINLSIDGDSLVSVGAPVPRQP